MMHFVFAAFAVYFGLVYLICGALVISKKIEGNMTWKEFAVSILIGPGVVACLILLNPVRVLKGLKKELEAGKSQEKE